MGDSTCFNKVLMSLDSVPPGQASPVQAASCHAGPAPVAGSSASDAATRPHETVNDNKRSAHTAELESGDASRGDMDPPTKRPNADDVSDEDFEEEAARLEATRLEAARVASLAGAIPLVPGAPGVLPPGAGMGPSDHAVAASAMASEFAKVFQQQMIQMMSTFNSNLHMQLQAQQTQVVAPVPASPVSTSLPNEPAVAAPPGLAGHAAPMTPVVAPKENDDRLPEKLWKELKQIGRAHSDDVKAYLKLSERQKKAKRFVMTSTNRPPRTPQASGSTARPRSSWLSSRTRGRRCSPRTFRSLW